MHERPAARKDAKRMLALPRCIVAPGIVLAMAMVIGRVLPANGACVSRVCCVVWKRFGWCRDFIFFFGGGGERGRRACTNFSNSLSPFVVLLAFCLQVILQTAQSM